VRENVAKRATEEVACIDWSRQLPDGHSEVIRRYDFQLVSWTHSGVLVHLTGSFRGGFHMGGFHMDGIAVYLELRRS